VHAYVDEFLHLAAELGVDLDHGIVHKYNFQRGLCPSIYDEVHLMRPETCTEAISFAIYVSESSSASSSDLPVYEQVVPSAPHAGGTAGQVAGIWEELEDARERLLQLEHSARPYLHALQRYGYGSHVHEARYGEELLPQLEALTSALRRLEAEAAASTSLDLQAYDYGSYGDSRSDGYGVSSDHDYPGGVAYWECDEQPSYDTLGPYSRRHAAGSDPEFVQRPSRRSQQVPSPRTDTPRKRSNCEDAWSHQAAYDSAEQVEEEDASAAGDLPYSAPSVCFAHDTPGFGYTQREVAVC
jgi:hypothetical protein